MPLYQTLAMADEIRRHGTVSPRIKMLKRELWTVVLVRGVMAKNRGADSK